MEDSSIWAVIWLVAAATFGIGEILMAGSFFLLPFAAGSLAAFLASVLTAPPLISWLVFLVASVGSFIAMRPLARRLETNSPDVAGIGANRLEGATGIVMAPISATPGDAGLVKVGSEEWRADTKPGVALSAGTKVEILEVRGTRLLVQPIGIDDVTL
jgi:membrane protein implicated in regulation of membrane protease activity